MPGLNIEISIIIHDPILHMKINWIFQTVDGDCVKANFNATTEKPV